MHWLESYWYRLSPLHLVLWPLSVLFGALAALRRGLYRAGLLARTLLRFALAFAFFLVAATGSLRKRDWLVAETILAEPGGRIKRFT